eukprot:3708950-Rhodomonas_salina.1
MFPVRRSVPETTIALSPSGKIAADMTLCRPGRSLITSTVPPPSSTYMAPPQLRKAPASNELAKI